MHIRRLSPVCNCRCFVMRRLLIITLILLCGCTTTATFEPGKVTVNASGVKAVEEVKADGSVRREIDTTGQNWWDIVKSGFGRVIDAVGGVGATVTLD